MGIQIIAAGEGVWFGLQMYFCFGLHFDLEKLRSVLLRVLIRPALFTLTTIIGSGHSLAREYLEISISGRVIL
jgi:hypothetical protein